MAPHQVHAKRDAILEVRSMRERQPIPLYVSLGEAAACMSVSVKTIRRWIADGTLPAYRCGKRAIRVRWRTSRPRRDACRRLAADDDGGHHSVLQVCMKSARQGDAASGRCRAGQVADRL